MVKKVLSEVWVGVGESQDLAQPLWVLTVTGCLHRTLELRKKEDRVLLGSSWVDATLTGEGARKELCHHPKDTALWQTCKKGEIQFPDFRLLSLSNLDESHLKLEGKEALKGKTHGAQERVGRSRKCTCIWMTKPKIGLLNTVSYNRPTQPSR